MSDHVHCVKCGKSAPKGEKWQVEFIRRGRTRYDDSKIEVGPLCQECTNEVYEVVYREVNQRKPLPLPLP